MSQQGRQDSMEELVRLPINVRYCQDIELGTRYGVFNDKKDPYVMEAIDFPS